MSRSSPRKSASPKACSTSSPATGETAGARIAAHPDVDKVAFTGSTEVGKIIVRAATGNLKKVTLELGGKSPNVIFADANIQEAIAGAAFGIFFNMGQCCTAGSRLFVERSVFDEVTQGVAAAAKAMNVGSGLDARTDIGPLVSDEQLDRVTGYIQSGISEGARARFPAAFAPATRATSWSRPYSSTPSPT